MSPKKKYMNMCPIHRTKYATPSPDLIVQEAILEKAVSQLDEFREANHGNPFMGINCIGVSTKNTLLLFYHPEHGAFTEHTYHPSATFCFEIYPEDLPKMLCGQSVSTLTNCIISLIQGISDWNCYALYYEFCREENLKFLKKSPPMAIWQHLDNAAETAFEGVLKCAVRRLREETAYEDKNVISLSKFRSKKKATTEPPLHVEDSLGLFKKYYPEEYAKAEAAIDNAVGRGVTKPIIYTI